MPFTGTLPEIECWCNDFLKCSAQNAMLNIAPALPIALTVMWIWFLNWIPTHGSQSATRRHIQRTMHQNSCRHLLELVGFLRGMLGLWIGEKLGSGSIKDPADSLLGQHGSFWLFLFCLAAAARPIAVGRNIRNSCARHFRAFLKVRSGIFCRSLVCKEKP